MIVLLPYVVVAPKGARNTHAAIANLLKAKKTVVMIAHTLSIVKNADQILVVADGTIKESGTHEELLAMNGKYAAMWNAEQKITV